MQAIVGTLINDLMSADPRSEGGDLDNVYKVGLNTSRLLMALGDLVVRVAAAASGRGRAGALGGEVTAKDKSFYEGKVAAAQFFARNVLPKLTAERAIAEATDLSVMELDESGLLTRPIRRDGAVPPPGGAAASRSPVHICPTAD